MYIAEVIRTIYNTSGKLTINESIDGYKTLRPFTKTEYNIFKKYIGEDVVGMKPVKNLVNEVNGDYEYLIYLNEFKQYNGKSLTPKIVKECKEPSKTLINEQTLKRYDKKVLVEILREEKRKKLISEDEVKVKNPETGKEILAKSAVSAGPSHPAYKAAKAALGGGGDSHGKDDGHGKGGHGDDHGDDHGHGHEEQSAVAAVAGAALDVGLKLAHSGMAGVIGGKVIGAVKGTVDRYKGAEGDKVIDKLSSMTDNVKSEVKNWASDKKAAFAASITDESTGERKSVGKIFKGKIKGVIKTAKDAIVHEVEHIGHGLKEGGEFLKKAVTDPKNLTSDDWKKAAKGLEAAAHVGIIVAGAGAAIATGGGALGAFGAVGAKAAKIAARDGALSALLTAHMYTDLQHKGLLRDKLVNENNGRLLKLIVEKEVSKINDDTFLESSTQLIGEGLESDHKPSEYDEDNMTDLTRMSGDMIDVAENASKGASSAKGDDKKEVKKESINKMLENLSKFSYVDNLTEEEFKKELASNKQLQEVLKESVKFLQTKKKKVGNK